MRHHDHACPVFHCFAERRELDTIQPGPCGVNHRQYGMRVLVRVPVAGEVFGARKQLQSAPRPAWLLKPRDVSRTEPCNDLRLIAEGPGADDGIVRIVVYVNDRRKNGVNSRSARLGPHDIEHGVEQVYVFFHAAVDGRCYSALVGKACPSGDLLSEAALHIG